MIIEGALIAVAGGLVSGAGAYGAGAVLSGIGTIGVFFGLLLLILAIAIFAKPEYHTGLGIAVLILSLLSVFGGGGFFLGILLGVIGGILAIVFHESDDDDEPFPRSLGLRSAGVCGNCAKPLTPGSTVCSFCGTPLRPGGTVAPPVPSDPHD